MPKPRRPKSPLSSSYPKVETEEVLSLLPQNEPSPASTQEEEPSPIETRVAAMKRRLGMTRTRIPLDDIERAMRLVEKDPLLAGRVLQMARMPSARSPIRDANDAWRWFQPLLAYQDVEHLGILALDNAHIPLAVTVLTVGGTGYTVIEPRTIFRWALTAGRVPAKSILLAHNNPSGQTDPSCSTR